MSVAQDPESGDLFDPGIDILVGLTAVVLMSVIVLLPLANLAQSRNSEIAMVIDRLMRQEAEGGAHAARLLIVAGRDGATVSGPRPVFVPLDAILDDPLLRARIAAADPEGGVPVLFIEESGQEAAFVLETLFSRAGLASIARVYLDGACGFFRPGHMPARCDFGAGSSAGGGGGETAGQTAGQAAWAGAGDAQ
ncbi:hypothetical protein [Breoghania sp. JC706]|uniref:hypothetical protein n=1 Tax=Breoghania sp. JC706 TaxID=3117732 RepID=UPI00300A35F8